MSHLDSNNLLDNRLFITMNSDVEERLDPLYYLAVKRITKNVIDRAQFRCDKLIKSCLIKRGRFGHRPRNDPDYYDGRYPFIQTGDIVKAAENNSEIAYTQTLNEKGLGTSRLFEGPQLLFTIAANIGDTSILNYSACFPDSIVALQPKDKNVSLEYLNFYLRLIKPYIVDLAPYSAQRNLNNQQLSQVPLVIPPNEIQLEVVRIMEDGYDLKERKEKQAQELVDRIDEYLLSELGVVLPEKDNSLKSRIFKTRLIEISGKRTDSYYYKEEFKAFDTNVQSSAYAIEPFRKLIKSITNGLDFRDYKESGIPYLKVGNIKPGLFDFKKIQYISFDSSETSKNVQLKKGNLLLTRKGSFGNALSLNQDYDYVISSEVFYLELDKKKVNSNYLEILLNSSIGQIQFDRNSIGAIMGSLSQEAVNQIKIPLPSLDKQKAIFNHVEKIRNQAMHLKNMGDYILESAKKEVEDIILSK